MKLLQFSTKFCPPCRLARTYIEMRYAPDDNEYEWIDLENLNNITEFRSILEKVNVRSVPTFVTIDENENIMDKWVGFNTKRIEEFFNGGLQAVIEIPDDKEE